MEFLASGPIDELETIRRKEQARKSRLSVVAGKATYKVLRRWRGGFALDASEVTRLRGIVDLYEGKRHVAHCLIVATEIEGGELLCTLKRENLVSDRAAVDFDRDAGATDFLRQT
ncbi:hypothetical protein CCR83_11795 [Rhodobacter veldkampii DSM 11550]|uniref:Uncharacterized protein n=1 Tax=Phaeovulum veldkampii DSM 11550 TaxID=1185920 RepID=A0A2T4JL41_9RHOB|nr:hypothetical protein [Phaeovulum veldkampii]MBK5947106.1 hypothetical protein [Phaeovulum veldkampii DSM 11550]NCU19887.1 hypothetical protein [Candidatus Falkowbacteria bacterium]PTE18614.1 hypothetical protein C5F46_03135 [Phaeovulum veldkampii DSM 11550]TDQ57236.1 hypothetical protein EV658_11313 [Phaeovulum veldkampii DSM 11550]